MASYLPDKPTPRHWQTDAPHADPVKRNPRPSFRSGSGRSYGSTYVASPTFAAFGATAQNILQQGGNLALYSKVAENQLADKNKETDAVQEHNTLPASPDVRRGADAPALGSGMLALGPGARPMPAAPTPIPMGGAEKGTFDPRKPGLQGRVLEHGVSGLVGSHQQNEQLSLFGRAGFQPDLAPGNTTTPVSAQVRDNRAADARLARQRKAGLGRGFTPYA